MLVPCWSHELCYMYLGVCVLELKHQSQLAIPIFSWSKSVTLKCTEIASLVVQESSLVVQCLYNVCTGMANSSRAHEKVIFSCDQAAPRTLHSVCLSVCLSVRPSVTPFSLCSHHRIILKFSGVITIDRRDVHAKVNVRGQRSTSQRSWLHLAVSGP